MRLLALDTATPLCGVAVVDGPRGLAAVRRERVTTHSERLLLLISACLEELGLRPGDLQAVACGAGPGSFTGLRIGAATAKGLCFALGAPLLMVSSLEVLAARCSGARLVLACLDARSGQTVYARLWGAEAAGLPEEVARALLDAPGLAQEAAWPADRLREALLPLGPHLTLCGDAVLRFPQLQVPGSTRWDEDPSPHPLDLARLGAARLLLGQHDPLALSAPNYICRPAAELAREQGAR